MKEEWKIVQGYRNLWASNFGNVATFNGEVFETLPNTNGPGYYSDYIANEVIGERGGKRTELQHVLVAKAFHQLPDTYGSEEWMVNHKDGNKRNNYPDNLEWVTRSENLRHSYEAGLRGDACNVCVTDHATGVTTAYYAMSEVARVFQLSKTEVATFCLKYRDSPWQGRYTFHRDVTNKVTSRHTWVKTIYGMNYADGTLHVANDSAKMEYLSKISRTTILWNLRERREQLVNGWVFKYIPDSFPTFTSEEIVESISAAASRKPPAEKVFGVEVKDYRTGEIQRYDTFSEAAESTGTAKSVIAYLCQLNTSKLVDGRIYRKPSDESFPEYDARWISASIGYNKECKRVIEVLDLHAETTTWYATFQVFAKATGTNAVAAANSFRTNSEKPFMKRYLFKELTTIGSPSA